MMEYYINSNQSGVKIDGPNPKIGFSKQEWSYKLGCCKNTVIKAFKELVDDGFLIEYTRLSKNIKV
jgi:hypothetical protein